MVQASAHHITANAAEAVNAYFDGHALLGH
jgi:hypothetical protein